MTSPSFVARDGHPHDVHGRDAEHVPLYGDLLATVDDVNRARWTTIPRSKPR